MAFCWTSLMRLSTSLSGLCLKKKLAFLHLPVVWADGEGQGERYASPGEGSRARPPPGPGVPLQAEPAGGEETLGF